ncbi:hypothetical protein [Streptomyces mayteni]
MSTAIRVRRERVISGLCRYADEHPAYADFHSECRGNWVATIRHDSQWTSTLRGFCDCPCHAVPTTADQEAR